MWGLMYHIMTWTSNRNQQCRALIGHLSTKVFCPEWLTFGNGIFTMYIFITYFGLVNCMMIRILMNVWIGRSVAIPLCFVRLYTFLATPHPPQIYIMRIFFIQQFFIFVFYSPYKSQLNSIPRPFLFFLFQNCTCKYSVLRNSCSVYMYI